jgi:Protein of unknown function (DUF1566)
VRRFAAFTGAAAAVVLAAVVRADAPPDQYGPFDQATPTITDRFTNLVWDRYVSGAVTFPQATLLCGAPKRLPTVKELLTLVDEVPHLEYDDASGTLVPKAIDANAFPGTPAALFWTASTTATGQVFLVDFSSGKTGTFGAGNTAYYRCVR